MPETDLCHFEIETPAAWDLPAERFWVAGWLVAKGNTSAQAVRLWLDDRPFAGMFGLPRPEIEERIRGVRGLPHAGFSFLIESHRGARLLRLEVGEATGRWTEIWRTPVQDAHSPARKRRRLAAAQISDAVVTVLKERRQNPGGEEAALARRLVEAAATAPLEVLPSPSFWGALEEPTDVGNTQFNKMPLTGWIIHAERRIVRLFASVDPATQHTIAYGLERKDATRMFPGHPYAGRSRFVGLVDVAENGPEPAGLRVFAELEDGSRQLVFHRHFFPKSCRQKERAAPPYRWSGLWSAATLVRRASVRAGLAPGFAWDWLRALWTAREWYRQNAPATGFRGAPRPAPVAIDAVPRGRRALLITHNLNLEGAPLFLLDYAGWLTRHAGWTFAVLSLDDGPLRAGFEALGARVTIGGWTRERIRWVGAFHSRLRAASRLVDWSAVDLVVCNTVASYWGVPLARRAGRPSIFYIHESATIFRFFEKALPLRLHRLVAGAFRRATRVSFLCEATMDYYQACAGPDNYRLVPGWIDVAAIARFRRENDRAALRRKHGLDPADVVIANIGSVCERKGQHTFIRAVEQFKRRAGDGRRYRFLMVGGRSDSFEELLRNDLAVLGLSDDVIIVPETREAYDFFALADLFVCSSYEESFPRVVLEAMAFRLPIVSTNVHGIPEIVRTGREAWLVPAGDPAAMAEAMRTALAEAPTAAAMAAAAEARVQACFASEVVFPLHAALAAEALGGSGPR